MGPTGTMATGKPLAAKRVCSAGMSAARSEAWKSLTMMTALAPSWSATFPSVSQMSEKPTQPLKAPTMLVASGAA